MKKTVDSRIGEGKRPPITSLPILPGVIVLAVAAILVFAGVLFVMRRAELIEFPQFIENWFNREDAPATRGELSWEEIIADIGGNRVDVSYNHGDSVDWSSLTLDEIFSVDAYPNYYQIYTVTYRTGDRQTSSNISYMRSSDKRRIEFVSGKLSDKTVITDGERVKITDDSGSKIFSLSDYEKDFTPEGEVGMPTATDLKAKLYSYAECDYSIEFLLDSSTNVMKITLTDKITGNREEYELLTESGVITSMVMYRVDESLPYYELRTSALVTDVNFSGAQFIIND